VILVLIATSGRTRDPEAVSPRAPAVAIRATPVEAPPPALPASALAGPPSHYVLPGAGPAVVWRGDPGRGPLTRLGVLGPFMPVRAAGAVRDGLQPIALAGGETGYIDAARLMAGDARDAERARCTDAAGMPPTNGEVLRRGAPGTASVTLVNRAPTAAVVTLRDQSGHIAARVFLTAGGIASPQGLAGGPWSEQAQFGEAWSRGCDSFISGARWQQASGLIAPGAYVPIEPDAPGG
jgi:hypothetical protein